MILLLLVPLLIGAAYGAEKDSQCLKDALGEENFDDCDIDKKVTICEKERDKLVKQVAAAYRANKRGVRPDAGDYALTASYGGKTFGFATSSVTPKSAAYQKFYDNAVASLFNGEYVGPLEFHWDNANPKVSGVIKDDASLEEAFSMAKTMGFHLAAVAKKATDVPTPNPTPLPTLNPTLDPKTWSEKYHVHQGFKGIRDGRDSGFVLFREFEFTKMANHTALRIHYEDNIRAYHTGANCYWELYVDGAACPSGYIRGAMQSVGPHNNDHQTASIIGLCTGVLSGKRNVKVKVYGNNKDCYTGWDPDFKGLFMIEVREVISGQFGYWGMTDRGKTPGDDNMSPVTGRVLKFKKKSDETRMRLLYQDNIRVLASSTEKDKCKWYIKVNGGDCGGITIGKSIITSYGKGENDHQPQAFAGYCDNLKKGDHVMTISLRGTGDCFTGWQSSFHLEAEELDKGSISVLQRYDTIDNIKDSKENGWVNHRVLNFKKKSASSIMRLFYSDNLRVYGHGVWCKWELKIGDKDGNNMKSCTHNIAGARYAVDNQNNHIPSLIVGYCLDVPEGEHQMRVYVSSSGDCYTGQDMDSYSTFLLEAREIEAKNLEGQSCLYKAAWLDPECRAL